MKDIHNFTEKNISEFTNQDTLYAQVKVSGFSYNFLLKFISFEKGIVLGEVISIEPNNTKHLWVKKELIRIGGLLSSKITNCYTYNKENKEGFRGCCWFKKDTKSKEYKCN
jgi:hypothetical protein